MLTIYGAFRSRAFRVLWAAAELGIDYVHVPVVQARRVKNAARPDAPLNTASPAYVAVNPHGKIPAIDDDGFVLAESLAINLYLACKYGGSIAPHDLREQSLMTQWALWAATAVEPHAQQILFHRSEYPEDRRDPAAAEAAIAALERPLSILSNHLGDHSQFLIGGRFTVADINAAEVLRYAEAAPEVLANFPDLGAWLSACQARPAFKAAMVRRSNEAIQAC